MSMVATRPAAVDDRPVRPRLRVGLVNNMPDAAVAATERQFRDLLHEAAPDRDVELALFQLPEVRRRPEVQAQMAERYRTTDAIAGAELDAMVVTGAEAGAGPLKNAPYWSGFSGLVDLALAIKLPTFWSCLAAHAAVEHLDGIVRRRLPDKYSGLYDCAPVWPSPLLDGMDAAWPVPHSRYHGVDETELAANGYEILTRSAAVGADVFARPGPPLFLFCQGHPEYDANSLALEYKRDVRAYLGGERTAPPALPDGLPEGEMKRSLTRLADAVANNRATDARAQSQPGARLPRHSPEWRPYATLLYRNWLRLAV